MCVNIHDFSRLIIATNPHHNECKCAVIILHGAVPLFPLPCPCARARVDLQLRVSRLGAVSNWKLISWPSCCGASHTEEREKSAIWRKGGKTEWNDDDKMATTRAGSAQNFSNICKRSIKHNCKTTTLLLSDSLTQKKGVFFSHNWIAQASFLVRRLCLSVFHNFERDICRGFWKPLLLISPWRCTAASLSSITSNIAVIFISYETLRMNISVAPCHVTLWVCHVTYKCKKKVFPLHFCKTSPFSNHPKCYLKYKNFLLRFKGACFNSNITVLFFLSPREYYTKNICLLLCAHNYIAPCHVTLWLGHVTGKCKNR